MNFFSKVGKMFLGSRLRVLSEQMMEDAQEICNLYGVSLKPKWVPVFYVLSHQEEASITDLAEEIGQSHPSIIKTVREMIQADLAFEGKDPQDKRKNIIKLSEKGRTLVETIQPQYEDVNQAVEDLLKESRHDIWEAVEEFEYLLNERSMFRRVQAQKKKREAQFVEIVPYEPAYAQAFKDLNIAWISKYFTVEEIDLKYLDHPQTYILDRGGHIVVALYKGEPVGVCALAPMEQAEFDFELAKMAVSPKAQGKGIGYLLGQACLEKAKALGAKTVFLESNTVLAPAIQLYQKLGFRRIVGIDSPYTRCNIQMQVEF